MRVSLSKTAEKKMDDLLDFIENKWSINQKQKFFNIFIKATRQISNYPKSCKKSFQFPDLYKCIFSKQTCFYYRIRLNEIEIITIIDNRQNPNEVQNELNKFIG